jgi:hypothetical protein
MNPTPSRRAFLGSAAGLAAAAALPARAAGAESLEARNTVSPPEWALLQRELLHAHTAACEAFFARYFDERGYLQAYIRWGANDGPDDAIENVNEWPHLHALGGSDRILELYKKAWEGHLRQYTEARTVQVPFAREGMYYKEFPVMMDWQHISEGLSVFNLQGLSDPNDRRFRDRARRYAGFYMAEDPGAPNYDPARKVIRSMFNGSRGPLLRKATPLDWAGDPFEAGARFHMEHGESSYAQTLAHYREYTDIVGDNPLNLQATTLGFNAYMLDHEPKYRAWMLDYLGAWIDRARRNDDILPSNVGLDGAIGGSAGGKWYGGVYGWGFSPVVPQTGKREDRNRVPRSITAFMNAYVMTGDDEFLDVWRRQTDRLNAQARTIDGQRMTPTMFGDQGWYGWKPGEYALNGFEIWYLSMKPSDRARTGGDHPWVAFLEGRNPDFPAKALRADLDRLRARAQAQRDDRTTPDTRLTDATLDINPASVTALIHLTQGGIHIARPSWSKTSPSQGGAPLYARLRHFDPVKRRAGLPEGVAALVTALGEASCSLTLVNVDQIDPRQVTVQAGGYGEHQFTSIALDGAAPRPIDASAVTITLAPGAAAKLELGMKRHANKPTLAFPWERGA